MARALTASGARAQWREADRLVSYRPGFASGHMFKAVREQDFEKVKVRRPLEAVTSNECGSSRGVCLGLASVDP